MLEVMLLSLFVTSFEPSLLTWAMQSSGCEGREVTPHCMSSRDVFSSRRCTHGRERVLHCTSMLMYPIHLDVSGGRDGAKRVGRRGFWKT